MNTGRDKNGRFIKGHKHSKEELTKISESLKRNQSSYFIEYNKLPKTEEYLKKLSEAQTGTKRRPHTEDEKKQISERMKLIHQKEKNIITRSRKPEVKEKIKRTMKTKEEECRLRAIEQLKKTKKAYTSIELKVISELRNNNIKDFKTQETILNRYSVDIFFPKSKLVVECDGEFWHSLPRMILKDQIKDKTLKENGYRILRLKESEINSDISNCIEKIKQWMK